MRISTCTCSEMQLNLVGCDCTATRDAVVVYVFKDGYASDNKAKIVVEGGADVMTEVRNRFGSFATVYRQHPLFPSLKPAEKFNADYVREMSKGG